MEHFKLRVVEKLIVGSGHISTFTFRSAPKGTMTIEMDLPTSFGFVGDEVTIQIENKAPQPAEKE